MNQRTLKRIARTQAMVRETLSKIRPEIVGVEAVLLSPGKYCGRNGVVDGVMISPIGEVLACLMILRRDGKEVLNSDGASRTYWPLNLMRFTGKRIYYPKRRAA